MLAWNWSCLLPASSQQNQRCPRQLSYLQSSSSSYQTDVDSTVVSVNATAKLEHELDYTSFQTVYYRDSEVVIAYIHNDARRFYVYVGKRVQHIPNHTSPEQWHHIPGKYNPADEASRSLTASQ